MSNRPEEPDENTAGGGKNESGEGYLRKIELPDTIVSALQAALRVIAMSESENPRVRETRENLAQIQPIFSLASLQILASEYVPRSLASLSDEELKMQIAIIFQYSQDTISVLKGMIAGTLGRGSEDLKELKIQ